ncbi:glycosyltransferase family 8 protein [Roridomyces roridus]|uniref:Glycosyltransferase family 8 protein n=1 Tax=Roridomyces roridus TaxID=1738132 RepID=A0AAD7C1M6_9AGAR|nr:glycosyltransferase family 8 protein [Roridomyces roridus]
MLSTFASRALGTERWTYRLLNQNTSSISNQNQTTIAWSRRWKAAFIGGAILVIVLAWIGLAALARALRIKYVSLDRYQDLCVSSYSTYGHGPVFHTPPNRRAVVTTLYSDGYAIGVAVLGHSAKAANISARLLLPYFEHKVSPKALCIARAVGWEPMPIPRIPPPKGEDAVHWRYKDQYTKLSIWKLDEMGVDSAVYLDADTMVRSNFDELFDSPFNFAAIPDVWGGRRGFSVDFNAGVLAFRPSTAVFGERHAKKLEIATYPIVEAEQAFLNLYFGPTALRLPYIYNANLAIKRRNPALWKRITDEMRVVHYTLVKPFVSNLGKPADALLSPEELDEAVTIVEGQYGGLFKEEVGWWKEEYEMMMMVHGHTIEQCYSS